MIEVSRVEEDIETRYQRGEFIYENELMKLGVKELYEKTQKPQVDSLPYETEEETRCTRN